MSKFTIEKGIPIPDTSGRAKYPWPDLEIGDSFLVPGRKVGELSTVRMLAEKRLGRRFVCRTVDGGVRIWRIE